MAWSILNEGTEQNIGEPVTRMTKPLTAKVTEVDENG